MKKISIICSFALLLALAVGCTTKDGIDQDLTFLNSAATANTNKMKFDIAKEVGNGKVIEITYHITDVFGMTKDLTFYVQTLN